MEEVIIVTTPYNAGSNRDPQGINSTGVDGSTPVTNVTRSVDGGIGISDVCTSSPPCAPPSVIWNKIIGNICKYTILNLSYTKELKSPIDGILTKDHIAPSFSSQILAD